MKKSEPVKNILSISDLSHEQLFKVILPKCEEETSFVEKRIPRKSDPTKKVDDRIATRGSLAQVSI